MKVLTSADMAAADRASVDEFGVSFGELMERAGTAVASFVLLHSADAARVLVLCGAGNNGGDGFVAARALTRAGRFVSVVLLTDEARLQGAAADAFALLDRSTIQIVTVQHDADLPTFVQLLTGVDLVVDAVVGTGFKPPLRGIAVAVRDVLQHASQPVVSVDVPSGWDADATVETVPGAFRSDAVLTFTAPKLAHMFGHMTANVFGPVVVAPIGSPADAVRTATGLTWTGVSKHIFEQSRAIDSNKGMYGHVMVMGGAAGKAGAPAMASLAALRAGAGLVTAAVPHSILNTVALITPELMTIALQEAEGGVSLANASPQQLEKLLKRITVLAIGPGVGTDGDAAAFVRKVVADTVLPIVLDADGLNAFHGQTDLLRGRDRTMVLTPHPGEMATLLGITTKQVQADRLNLARSFAVQHQVTLVLKGWRTLIAHPDGTVAVNTTGNPSMAKGGSGDILTGIVAACLAQSPGNVADAVNAAVYLHGLAADFAAHCMDEHTVLATDTVAHLSDAFRYRTLDGNGAEWICGLRMHGARR